ncbi:MAG: hypothetical protein QME14_00710 [Methanobacteriaceae archaeon]|nr:hypothetical protein [Methanobacteriaceae archaeon]
MGVEIINKNGKIVLGIVLGICVIFIIFGAIGGPIGNEEYKNKILEMDEQFREIVKDNSMYTTAGTPWREEEPVLKNILEELDEMEERGIPSEYQTFHYHFKNMIEYYILWQNSGSDDFEFMFSQEDNTTKQLWSTIN